MIGARLGAWVIERELGRGGMGAVYLAHPEGAENGVPGRAALKVLDAQLAKEAGFLQRFRREVEALSRLDHPNIVRFYEAGCQDGRYYYAMEYVAGRDFEDLLRERGPLPWKEVVAAALQVCPALKHAHDHGVIHRDLKPENLMRTEEGLVKLTDFGIARVFSSGQLTSAGGLVGTAEYLSPEQASGKPVTPRSDLYSLGVVLYQLLTGRLPFRGDSALELLHKHRFGQFERPQRLTPTLPPDLDALVCRLLEKDPARRPANARAVEKQLDSLRRRQERREQQTAVISPRETQEQVNGVNPYLDGAAGVGTLVSRWVREEATRVKEGGPVARFFNRPWVLAPLLLACVGLLAWGLWPRPGPPAEALFEQGSRLMASDNPADWDRAWDDYLGPLERRYPENPYGKELEQYRRLKGDHEAQERALAGLKRAAPSGEGERLYRRGLRLCQEGDGEGARAVWGDLVRSFAGLESERPWVRLAGQGLARLDEAGFKEAPAEGVSGALARARELARQGKTDEADAVWQGLERLYRDDPAGGEVLKEVRRDREQAGRK